MIALAITMTWNALATTRVQNADSDLTPSLPKMSGALARPDAIRKSQRP